MTPANPDPRTPVHAVARFDPDGQIPDRHRGILADEEDHPSLLEAKRWLAQRGGGYIELFDGGRYRFVEHVDPPFETAHSA